MLCFFCTCEGYIPASFNKHIKEIGQVLKLWFKTPFNRELRAISTEGGRLSSQTYRPAKIVSQYIIMKQRLEEAGGKQTCKRAVKQAFVWRKAKVHKKRHAEKVEIFWKSSQFGTATRK